MQITTFDPLVMTTDSEGTVKLFEDLGFVRRHTKDGADGREDIMGIRMKHENGFHVDIASSKYIKQDNVIIRMNVRDFDEAKALLEQHGFTSSQQGMATDTSMKSIGMSSPSGFSFSLVEHVRH